MKTKLYIGAAIFAILVLAVGGWTPSRGVRWATPVLGRCRLAPRVGRFLGALALPTFALALGISVLTTYAPLLLGERPPRAGAIGLAVGAEGAFALFLPLLIGSLSDRTQSRFGRRIPYALVGVPLLVVPLAILPFAARVRGDGGARLALLRRLPRLLPALPGALRRARARTHQGRAQGVAGRRARARPRRRARRRRAPPLRVDAAPVRPRRRRRRARHGRRSCASVRRKTLVPAVAPPTFRGSRGPGVFRLVASALTCAPSWPRTRSGSSPSWA